MKLNLKEYFKLSAIYTIVGALPPLLQLLVQPMIEGKGRLGAVDFSQMAIVETIVSMVFILVIHSTSYSLFRLYFDYVKDSEKFRRLVSTIFVSILFRCLLLIGIVLVFGSFIGRLFSQPALKDFSSYGVLAVVAGTTRALINVAGILYRNEKRVTRFVMINVGMAIFRSLFQVIGVYYWNMSFLGYLYGTVAGSLVVVVVMMFLIFRESGFAYDRQMNREIMNYGRPLFYYSVLNWGLVFSDRFFLEGLPVKLGIYDNAMKFALGIQLIIQGLQSASQPEIFRFMNEGIKEKLEEIKKLSNIQLLQTEVLIAFAILPTIVFIQTFYETDVRLSAGIIAIVFMKYVLMASTQVFSLPLYYMKITKVFFFINTGVLIINLVLNILLIPLVGFYGAIIASTFAMLVQTLLVYYYQNRKAFIPWNLKKVLYFPIFLVLFTALLELLRVLLNLSSLYTSAIVVVVTFAGILSFYKKELLFYMKKYSLF